MNATQGLVKSYITENASTTQYAAVIVGANADGNCRLPTAANQAGFLGFTLESQQVAGRGVATQKSGIARASANGAISRGDRCVIATSAGDVKSVESTIGAGPLDASPTEYNVVGRAEETAVAGQIFAIWITPETVPLAAS
jgi:hypothetical protein